MIHLVRFFRFTAIVSAIVYIFTLSLASCKEPNSLPTLISITATYTGTAVIYPTTSLNNLKTDLTVTAIYSDSTIQTVTDYTLSGTLAVGTSTITVTYVDKTATFYVNVSYPELSGTISISHSSAVTGTELIATYSGNESVNYQWKKDGNSIGTNANKYIPTVIGSYTVTVSAIGYNPKTSTAVIVFAATTDPTYTVDFDADGGTPAPAKQIVAHNGKVTQPLLHMIKTGYTFGGWYKEAALTNQWDFAMDTVFSDTTIYAKWDIVYTITYDLNGGNGTTPSAQIANQGASIILPSGSGLSKSGYAFNGWSTSTDDMGTNYSASSLYTPTNTITLYAKWEVTVYTITFNANSTNGTVPASRNVPTGYNTTLPGSSQAFANFIGWNTIADGSGINYAKDSSYIPTGNIATIILYAQWDVHPFASVTGFANKLLWLQAHVQRDTNTSYVIEVTSNESVGPQTLSYDRNGITIILIGDGTNRTISLSSNGVMFTVSSGVTLILNNNITLKGRSGNTNNGIPVGSSNNNNNSLVRVNGGTLLMNNGSTITGNTYLSNSSISSTYSYGGGVYVASGTFTMNGGTISNNTSSSSIFNANNYFPYSYGGGVYVASGTFTMNGGTISDNTASSTITNLSDCSIYSYGGGVCLGGINATFIMNGGTISDNTSLSTASGNTSFFPKTYSYGGGVYVGNGTFTMNGGHIFNNTSSTGTNIERYSSNSYGGGVYVDNGTFTMSGGTISGNTGNISSSNSGSNSYGGGVYVAGTFEKTGGTIYGYSVNDTVNSNVVKRNGIIHPNDNNRGHAVYGGDRNSVVLRRETTAGPDVNIYCSGNLFSGGWEF